MTRATATRYSAAEYLRLERKSEVKHELINGHIVAMSGGTRRHATICDSLTERVRARLRGTSCRAYSAALRVTIKATGNYTYPDLSIVCGEAEMEDREEDTLVNPRLIVEVLSPSTERHDRGWKFQNYQLIPSFEEYVLVSQEEPRIERFVRQGDVGWLMTAVTDLDQSVHFDSVELELPLAEIYEEVTFGVSPGEV
jgi:Uma2 family endonuclease